MSLGPIVSSVHEGFSGGPDKEQAAGTMEADTSSAHTVEFRGAEWTKEGLSAGLLEMMRGQPDADGRPDLLGDFVDRCTSADQCFAYYGDQLQKRQTEAGYALVHEGVELLTGKTADEVDWVGEGIRAGFVESTGIGWIESKSEVGRDKFQGMSGEKRKKFFADMFARHADTLSRLYKEAHIKERTPDDRAAVVKKAGIMIHAETEYHAQTARTGWKAQMKGADFEEWFTKGEGAGFASGDAQWQGEFAKWQEGIDGLYSHLGAHPIVGKEDLTEVEHERAADEATAAHHGGREQLFSTLQEKAVTSWFGSASAKRWRERARGEKKILLAFKR